MFRRINKEEAQQILKNQDAILIDVRDFESYEEGHLERAISVTQDKMLTFIENTTKSLPILVICYHGNSSQSVSEYLMLNGFTQVYSINGGYEGWIDN